MAIKELIGKQKQKMFENRIKKIVEIEDLKAWANRKTYVEMEQEKIDRRNNEEKRKT